MKWVTRAKRLELMRIMFSYVLLLKKSLSHSIQLLWLCFRIMTYQCGFSSDLWFIMQMISLWKCWKYWSCAALWKPYYRRPEAIFFTASFSLETSTILNFCKTSRSSLELPHLPCLKLTHKDQKSESTLPKLYSFLNNSIDAVKFSKPMEALKCTQLPESIAISNKIALYDIYLYWFFYFKQVTKAPSKLSCFHIQILCLFCSYGSVVHSRFLPNRKLLFERYSYVCVGKIVPNVTANVCAVKLAMAAGGVENNEAMKGFLC